MKKAIILMLITCAVYHATQAQSITNAPVYNGTAPAAGDNAYIPFILNNTLRKIHVTVINKDRIDSLVTVVGGKLTARPAITGATKTKITYGADGLVIAGADLAEGDIPALSIAKTTGLQAALDAKQASGDYATNSALTSGLATKENALGFTPVPNTRTVAGKALSANITLDKTDVGLSNVDNTSDATKWAATATLTNKTLSGALNTFSDIPQGAVSNLSTDLAAKVTANAAITEATKAKITYDAKGLVTGGNDLAEADIPTLPISKTSGLQAALDGKQPLGDYATNTALTNGLATKQAVGDYATNDALTAGLNDKVDVEAGKGLSEANFTDAMSSKLENIQAGATANQTDAYLLSRVNHTGYLPSSAFDPATLEELDPAEDESISAMRAVGGNLVKQTVGVNLLSNTGNSGALSDGRAYYQPLYFNKRDTINTMKIDVTTAFVGTADNNNKIGLYKYMNDGTISLVASTANDATLYTTAGIKEVALSAQYIVTEPGLYFSAVIYNNSAQTTAPQIRAGASRTGANQTGDVAGTTNRLLFYTTSADLPASVTMSSASASGISCWVGACK